MTGRRNPLTMLGELQGYLLGVAVVLCVVATAVVFLPQPQKASAFPGRVARYGYFTNQYDGGRLGNKVIQNGIYNNGLTGVDSLDDVPGKLGFISRIRDHLNGWPATSTTAKNDQIGAAFIILDMLQYPPDLTTPYTDRSIAEAQAKFAKWEAGIRDAGSINFSFQNFPYNTNTYYQLPNTTAPATTGDIAWVSQIGQAESIVIYWKGGGYYAVKKICANPVGDGNIKGIPNYLSALHMDNTNPAARLLMPSDNLNNNIACPSPYVCTAVNRSGNAYSIQLDPNKYTVSNYSAPYGYTYTGWELYKNGEAAPYAIGSAPSVAADFITDYENKNFAIIWLYTKNPGQNCDPWSQKVGIGEKAKLTSSVPAPYQWATNAWAATPSTGTTIPFEPSYNQVGNFPVTLVVNSTTSTCWVIVTQKPYIRAYGGDIFAGSSPNCAGWIDPTTPIPGIYGFTGPPVGAGSGAQLGVLAMGQIWGFNSAMLRTTAPAPPNGLTFGNTFTYAGTPVDGMLSVSHCPPDYWGQIETTGPVAIASSNIVLSTVKKTEVLYYSTGDDTAVFNIGPTSLVDGLVSSVYVKGSLVIKGDIKYTGANSSWASAGDIPRLQIVVTGNIYIDRTVTQLDGVYVAQGGTIYTCTDKTTPLILLLSTSLYDDCNTQLTVNGALLATRIKWLRTFGDLSNSVAGEIPSSLRSCTSKGSTVPNKPTCASEVVNLGPEAWMEQSSSVNPTANYVQALPPLL